MANAVEEALNRGSEEQKARAHKVIEEARRNIQLVSVRDDITPTEADTVARQAKIIEEAKQKIPFETMRDVDEISAPLPTPNNKAAYTSKVVELHPDTAANIEAIEQGGGNNYLRENAVDRALARQKEAQVVDHQQEQQRQQQEQEKQYTMGR